MSRSIDVEVESASLTQVESIDCVDRANVKSSQSIILTRSGLFGSYADSADEQSNHPVIAIVSL